MRNYRNRENEILFMDLREMGLPFEKKYIQFSEKEIQKIANTYHNWQQENYKKTYKNIPEFCYSAIVEEVKAKDYSQTIKINKNQKNKFFEFKDLLPSKLATEGRG